MDEDTLWTLDDVAAYLKVCRRTAVDLVRQPGFPARIRVTSRSHRWLPAQVRRWARERQDALARPPRRVEL